MDLTGENPDPDKKDSETINHPLRDQYGRVITHLRVSVTDRCNLRCVYCHMEGSWTRNERSEMSPEEIHQIVSLFSSLGIRYLKLTGGEPTLRDDIVEIVRRVSSCVDEVSLVTNGLNLGPLARGLKDAGLKRVNISLNMCNPEELISSPSTPMAHRIISGIERAQEAGLSSIKLNMVVLRTENSHKIPEMISFARERNLILQLIELHMPREMISGKVFQELYFPLNEIEKNLFHLSERVEYARLHGRKRFHLKGGGCVEVVRPMFNPNFCMHCHRLRITSNGRIRPCLMQNDGEMDILTPLRNHAPREEILRIIHRAVNTRRPYWE